MATRQIAPVRVARRNDEGKPIREEQRTVWTQDGLAVTESFVLKEWVVTHVASGYAVLHGFRTQRDASAAARQLLILGDWSVSRSRVSRAMQVGAMTIRAELRDKGVIPWAS